MSPKGTAKGARFERVVLDYLRDHAYRPVVRVHDGGQLDEGDLRVRLLRVADDDWSLDTVDAAAELKNYRNLGDGINAGFRGLDDKVQRARADVGLVIARRHGKPDPADALLCIRLGDAVDLGWL